MPSAFSALLVVVVILSLPAYLVLQPVATIRLEGRWRVASLAPLLLMLPAAGFSLYALAQSSNLWPMTLILSAPFGAVYLIVLLAVHHARTGSRD
ncbi:MAG: hypothetical protein U1E70_15530 [Acetobacteraceae bacterium]|nr:hypothetical protein [Pseudomonadota bacterium]